MADEITLERDIDEVLGQEPVLGVETPRPEVPVEASTDEPEDEDEDSEEADED